MMADAEGFDVGQNRLRLVIGNFERLLQLAKFKPVLSSSLAHITLKLVCRLNTNVISHAFD